MKHDIYENSNIFKYPTNLVMGYCQLDYHRIVVWLRYRFSTFKRCF